MQGVLDYLGDKLSFLTVMQFQDFVDIAIVAFLIYKVIDVIRKTSSYNVARGILVFLIVLGLSGVLKLTMINYILRKAVDIGLIALIVLFQPELRKLLGKLGTRNFYSIFSPRSGETSALETAITQTVIACEQMSETKTGALIIFERDFKLSDMMSTGTVIDADITAELIKNIFYPKAPLHDGAMIIRDSRIAAAGCVLPLTAKTNLSKDLGMRHRAGIGASEQSDALVVIVSEETGAVSIAVEGMLKRNLNTATFEKILRSELLVEAERKNTLADFVSHLFDRRKVSEDGTEKED